MTFLEWIITWFFADHLASKQEVEKQQDRFAQEIENLKFEIESFREGIDYMERRR